MPTTRSQTKALTETEKLKAELKIKKQQLKIEKAEHLKLRKAQIIIEKEEKAARVEAKKIRLKMYPKLPNSRQSLGLKRGI